MKSESFSIIASSGPSVNEIPKKQCPKAPRRMQNCQKRSRQKPDFPQIGILTKAGGALMISRRKFSISKDNEKEEYIHNPAREEDPPAERSSKEVWMEGSF